MYKGKILVVNFKVLVNYNILIYKTLVSNFGLKAWYLMLSCLRALSPSSSVGRALGS